jgi:hypothetical protein
VKENFGIRPCSEPVTPPFEMNAEFHIVKHLSVEDNPEGLILIGQGLIAACEINDRQAGMSESDPAVAIEATAVRSAVTDSGDHPVQLITAGS